MILSDKEIQIWVEGGGVVPACLQCINPASLDLRLGREFITLPDGEKVVDNKICLEPGVAILATTVEYIKMPEDVAGFLLLKSTWARRGLDHSLAGFVDPGFEGELTMELHAHTPLEVYSYQRVVQLVLCRMSSVPEFVYDGRYQYQEGPTLAKDM